MIYKFLILIAIISIIFRILISVEMYKFKKELEKNYKILNVGI